MPDFRSPPPQSAEILPNLYPTCGYPATPTLRQLILEKIAKEGPLPFEEFMACALYHPECGYYAKEPRQVGREGDFYTSVSVGPVFGMLLARRFLRWWEENERPGAWRIIEAGAHDGTLAADILREIRQLSPMAFSTLEYAIPEPLPRLMEAQKATLSDFAHVRFVQSPADLSPDLLPGIAFGNEVLDALPFEMIIWKNGGWHQLLVTAEGEAFAFTEGPAIPDGPEGTFPEGYTTEMRRNHGTFFSPFLQALKHGCCLWFDYGYDHETYYHPDRNTGTVRTFSKHRAGENPLAAPGEEDITAHVDFTSAVAAASSLGCETRQVRTQSAWLTGEAREWLLSMEGNPDASLLRQFQTLTHPGHLGSRFHVLEFLWKPASEM